VAGAVALSAMKTLDGDTVNFDVSLLVRATVTPPTGAADNSVTGYGRD
jgi:hypothetical protein